MQNLDIFRAGLGGANNDCYLTYWVNPARNFHHSPRYDLMPVSLFERLGEGRFFRMAAEAQQHEVVDLKEPTMGWRNSHTHNEERVNWVAENATGKWHIFADMWDTGTPQRLVWSFSNVNDALLFKLTWHD